MQKSHNGPDLILERIAKLASIFLAILVAIITLKDISPLLAYSVAWSFAMCFVIFWFPHQGKKIWLKVRNVLIFILLILVFCLLIYQFKIYNSAKQFQQTIASFEQKLSSLIWIAYEPTGYDPYKKHFPQEQEIERELAILNDAGFTGVITFSSQQSHGRIPQIAKKQGFRGVIMGIIDVTNKFEIQNALQASPYVDAYCVGHMFTDHGFTIYEVLKTMNLFRKKTKRPVSTTLRPNGYKVFPEISRIVDWIFPDIHGNWYSKSNSSDVLKQTRAFIKDVSELQVLYPNKPVLLKMISFPSSEAPGASFEEQYNFYRVLTEYVVSSIEFPERVYPSYFSAFDLLWKTPERGWPLGERYVGFFHSDGTPKQINVDGKTVCSFHALIWSRAKLIN